ncbi:PREDICTED: uncharacterized protein LOC109209964 [Nicotiana attenuata]|uniref:uncharacterized protein LOC109209964 n=1 Tax=Nicotiana attenuata TaxID=49451 RepID=UPI0009056907|nr:PREDICTED: uncharacterized protein LOC109209964 [Nicotiana attenuata]
MANLSVRLLDVGYRRAIVQNAIESSFVTKVKARQFDNLALVKIMESISHQKKHLFELPEDEVLKYKGRLCVSDVSGLRGQIMIEIHQSKYSIHPRSTKTYHDLRQLYWWNYMKRNIAEYVAKCPNCQQVKIEHQKPGGLLLNMEIPA